MISYKPLERILSERKIQKNTFAKESGVGLSTLIRILGGKGSGPTLNTLLKMAHCLDVELTDLFEEIVKEDE